MKQNEEKPSFCELAVQLLERSKHLTEDTQVETGLKTTLLHLELVPFEATAITLLLRTNCFRNHSQDHRVTDLVTV